MKINIGRKLEARGISSRELAKKANVSHTTTWRLYRDGAWPVRPSTKHRLVCAVSSLLGDADGARLMAALGVER
ncbi:MAG: hypothetical protein L6R48_10945 [Planctomycetes bacterium]|nr:hypothetical protein [Planctomycetota bacterium]